MSRLPVNAVLSLLALSITACTITQTATPVSLSSDDRPKEICVIEQPAVFSAFLPALRDSLAARGLSMRLLPKGASTDACPLTATYVAYRSWDFTTYMSQARIQIYQSGNKTGEAIYEAPKGGWSMTTRIYESTESKVETMVAQLFPTLPRKTSFKEPS